MCGINGIFAYHYAANPIDRNELARTRDHMAKRGPDGKGEWLSDEGRVGFGHRRLSIIDLSEAGAQPMTSADGKLIVTFNGEIYNYAELRKTLEAKGYRFRSHSDTEVLLHLYAEKGEEMVHDLRGMFAFGLWDAERRSLFLARDPYSIKPLYYTDDGWTFRFASQVKALLAGGNVSRDPEPAGLVGFHLWGSVPEPFTLYRDIRALPGGHTQWIDGTGPREAKPYATLAAILAKSAENPTPIAELKASVRAGVGESVRAHLLADVGVGIFLSAGIDSGVLLGLMREASQREIRAITLGFEEFRDTPEDEAPLAARVAERYGARHIVRYVGESEFRNDLVAILDAMDQPSIDGVNAWFASKAAKEAGLKVAISGLGGDELFAGYPSFSDLPRWRRRYGPLAAVPGLGRLSRALIRAAAPQFARARPKAVGMLEHADTWAGAYLLRRGLFLPAELDDILDQDVVRRGLRRLNPVGRLSATLVPDPGSNMARVTALESSHYMRNQLLRDADWAGMAHSLEIRVPLVDYALLRQIAPAIHSLCPGAGKASLADAPVIPLPSEIVYRAKTGFGVPTGAWMDAAAAEGSSKETAAKRRTDDAKGLVSRAWARVVLEGLAA